MVPALLPPEGQALLWILLGLAGGVVLGAGIWLRRAQARYVALLREEGDPLADRPGTKAFRGQFQAWLLRRSGPVSRVGRTLLTVVMFAVIAAATGWSLWSFVAS